MPVDPAAVEILRALSGILPRFGSWYLFGAQAVIAYGVPRLSADVDVTLRLAGESTEAFVKDMRAAGFDAFLIGERFMRDADPGAALGRLLAAQE